MCCNASVVRVDLPLDEGLLGSTWKTVGVAARIILIHIIKRSRELALGSSG